MATAAASPAVEAATGDRMPLPRSESDAGIALVSAATTTAAAIDVSEAAPTRRRPEATSTATASPSASVAVPVTDATALGMGGDVVDSPKSPSVAFLRPVTRSRCSVASVLIALAALATFAIAVGGLVVAVQGWRPEVLLTRRASSPVGYLYGGAIYQGSGNWKAATPLPLARSDLSATVIGTAVYLVGGLAADPAPRVLTDVLVFDAIFETFGNVTTSPRLPVPRYRHGAAAVGSKLFVVGGVATVDGPPVALLHSYDIIDGRWQTLPNMTIPRTDVAAAALNGVLYVAGGYGVDYDMAVAGRLCEVYNPTTAVWTTVAPMPTSRGDAVALAVGGRVFVLGGWNDVETARGGGFQAAVEAYDPLRNTWSVHANMLVRKGDTTVALYRGKLFTVGGEVWSGLTGPCPWDPTATCDINQVPTHGEGRPGIAG